MCIHEGGLAFVKKNCEILWWNNFHFCHIVFIVHSWLGIEGFLSFVWCRCCGAESCFRRRLYFPTLLLTITRSREGGSPVETKDVCPQVIWPWFIQEGGVSSQWWKGRGKEGGREGRGPDETAGQRSWFCCHVLWVSSLGCGFQLTLVSRTFLLFLREHYFHFRRKKEAEAWQE